MRSLALAAVAMAACSSPAIDSQRLGGVDIAGATLERGRRVYQRNCLPCHGELGDGRGPAGLTSWPPPRDFTRAKFKYAGILDRGLPSDDELVRVISGGLAGTAMPAWDLPDTELRDVIDYLKTFSADGVGFRDPELAVSVPQVPPVPSGASLVADGERIYHEVFQCAKCHPAYAPKGTYDGLRAISFDAPAPKWSENYRAILVPTDFRRHRMRSVRLGPDGHDAGDLYRVIANGLQGPMPGYRHLGDESIWPVVFYVKSLADE